ncbi:FAD-dependent monooxygenase [Nocardiopsis coralliicola]
MDTTDTDVLIAGAGPTGLTAACALALQGVSVRIIDAADGPSPTSRANLVHARGAEVLDKVGALGDLPEKSVSALTITLHMGGQPVSVIRFGDTGLHTSRPALVTPQAQVEKRLRERWAGLGGAVEWGTRLTGIEQDGGGTTATVETAHGGTPATGTLRARWLLGADGAHSATRKLVGAAFPGAPVADTWLLADAHMDWRLPADGTTGWMHPDGVGAALPMRDPDGDGILWRLMFYAPGLAEDPPDSAEIVDLLRRMVPERSGIADAGIIDAPWTSVFRIHRRLVDSYRHGRVLLAGDAAHLHSPLGGQGMLTGIGDAENLAWKLALVVHGTAAPALLDAYQAERRPLAEGVLRVTTANSRLQVGDGALVRFVRERIMLPLIGLGVVQRAATRAASQLNVSYRKGPLGGRRTPAALRPGSGPAPGDRVADLPCLREDGTPTRLHAELRAHWVLLSSEPDPPGAQAVRDRLKDAVEVLTPRDRKLADMLLIRPDSHLLWRGGTAGAGLGAVLDGLLDTGRTR